MTRIRTALRQTSRDERGFVTSFFIRTVIVFALVAIVVNEAGQVLLTSVHAHNAAGAAAQAAADSYSHVHSLTLAHDAAVQASLNEDPQAKVIKITIDTTSGTAAAVVKETASTLVVSRVSFLQKYNVIRASEQETPATG
jgi:hypothetical protein